MYMTYIGIYVFIIGCLIGSFLNVCIYRVPKGQSIVFPGSHCTSCGKSIKWYDLIPILSYFILKGKCRYCSEKFSIRYVAIEFFMGVIFLIIYIKYGIGIEFFKYTIFVSILVVIAFIDLDTQDVYFNISITAIILAIVFLIYEYANKINICTYIYGALLGGGVITLIILITKGMGWGDVEVCFLCGLFLGIKLTIIMTFFSFVFGAVISTILIITKKRSKRDVIPFIPFVALGSVFSILAGDTILLWYLQFLN